MEASQRTEAKRRRERILARGAGYHHLAPSNNSCTLNRNPLQASPPAGLTRKEPHSKQRYTTNITGSLSIGILRAMDDVNSMAAGCG